MLLRELVDTSAAVTATRSRSAKVTAFAALLSRLEPDEVPAAVAFLAGEPRQGRIGVGWATVAGLDHTPAAEPTLTVADVDAALAAVPAAVARLRTAA